MLAGGLGAVLAVASAALGATPTVVGATEAPLAEGWWGRSTGSLLPADAPLPVPLPVPLPATASPAPDVPDGVIVVAAVAGQVVRVAAVGLPVERLADDPSSVLLTLRESGETVQQSGTGPKVLACPISGYWTPERGADLAEAPAADCTGAPAGTRSQDGTWRFDLSPVAGRLDDGVRLEPVAEPGATFQVGFTGAEDVALETAPGFGSGPSGGGSADGVTTFDGSAPSGFASGAFGVGQLAPPAPTSPRAAGARSTAPTTAPYLASSSTPATGSTLDGLSLGSVLLALVAVAVAGLAMWSLGRPGGPRAVTS
jgi:hypothetical protein